MEATANTVETTSGRGSSRLRRALGFAASHRREVIAIVGLTLVLAAFNAAEPLILKFIFDHLGAPDGQRVLLIGVAVMLGLGLAREAISGLSNWLTWRSRLGIHFNLLEATVGRLHRMPLRMQR